MKQFLTVQDLYTKFQLEADFFHCGYETLGETTDNVSADRLLIIAA